MIARDRKTAPSNNRTTPFSLVVGALGCVGLPAFVTAVAPVSYLHLQRHEGVVTARSETCLFFWIPYSRKQLTAVLKVTDSHHAGTVTRSRGSNVRSDDESFLVVQNEVDQFEVSISPVDVADALEQIRVFLDDSEVQSLKLTCVSNWKFAVFAAVPLCLLTLLYVIGVAVASVKWLVAFAAPRAKAT